MRLQLGSQFMKIEVELNGCNVHHFQRQKNNKNLNVIRKKKTISCCRQYSNLCESIFYIDSHSKAKIVMELEEN